MKIQVKNITPEFANKVLRENNVNNRKLMDTKVKLYCQDMRKGNWGLSHQGIAFNEEGDLIDGQHRLAAVVMYGNPVQMVIATGLPKIQQTNGHEFLTMDLIDRGGPRTVGQQLQMSHGVTNSNLTVAICSMIRNVCKPGNNQMTTAQALAVLNVYGDAIEAVVHRNYLRGDRKAAILAIFAMFHAAFPSEEEMFASQFISGENVKPKSPVSALRRWLINRASLADATSVRNALPYVVASAVMRFHDDQPAEKVTENVESLKRLKESQISKVRKIIDIFS